VSRVTFNAGVLSHPRYLAAGSRLLYPNVERFGRIGIFFTKIRDEKLVRDCGFFPKRFFCTFDERHDRCVTKLRALFTGRIKKLNRTMVFLI